jgi:hypothetical protein
VFYTGKNLKNIYIYILPNMLDIVQLEAISLKWIFLYPRYSFQVLKKNETKGYTLKKKAVSRSGKPNRSPPSF